MEAPAAIGKPSSVAERPRTVVLDLDDTLLSTNVLHELALVYVKQNPLRLLRLAAWLLKGRAYLKKRLSQSVNLPLVDRAATPKRRVADAFEDEIERNAHAADGPLAKAIVRNVP